MKAKKDLMQLNRREKSILNFIEKQVNEKGYPPSVREIGKAVGLSSTATVHGYLAKLAEKGYIKKEDQKGRTLRLLKGADNKEKIKEDKNFYSGREMVEVPVIGKITAGEPIYYRYFPNSNRFCWKFRKFYAYSSWRKYDRSWNFKW